MIRFSLVFFIFQFLYQAHSFADCEWDRKSYRYSNQSFTVQTIEYKTSSRPNKVILFLPPTGGTSALDQSTAKYFCKRGISTVILDSWTGYRNHYTIPDLYLHQTEIDNAKKALLALSNGAFKDKEIGIFAVSKGAIGVTAFKNELRSNVKSLFLVAAGAPLHLTISRAGAKVLSELRENRMRAYGINQDTYDVWIQNALKYRTVKRNPFIKVAMVMAKRDTVVPSNLQQSLVNWWKPDKLWTTNWDHFRTILNTHMNMRGLAFRFLSDSFN